MPTNDTETNSTYHPSAEGNEKVEFSTGEIIGLSLLNGVSGLVGTVGNLLVLVAVVSNKILRTRPDIFIASLAVADLLVTFLNQPMFIYHVSFYEETKGMYYGETTFFKIMALVGHIALLASVSNMFAVTVDRLISIRCPFKYKLLVTTKRVMAAISAAWFVSFAISLVYTVYMATGSEPNRLFLWCYCTLFLLAIVFIYVYILAVARRQENRVIILGIMKGGNTEISVFSPATHTCNR